MRQCGCAWRRLGVTQDAHSENEAHVWRPTRATRLGIDVSYSVIFAVERLKRPSRWVRHCVPLLGMSRDPVLQATTPTTWTQETGLQRSSIAKEVQGGVIYTGISGPDNDRTIFPTSLCGPKIFRTRQQLPRWSLSGPEISGPENDQIVWSFSGPGRCLVLLHRDKFFVTKCHQLKTSL